MPWSVIFYEQFDAEFQALDDAWQDELLAHAKLLQIYGPDLGRPAVDTLKGSKHANMKELRFAWEKQVWRLAFAFDPMRRAIFWQVATKAGPIRSAFTNA